MKRVEIAELEAQLSRHLRSVENGEEIEVTIFERAAEPFPTPLGTLDALHLGTAVAAKRKLPGLSLATHDRELAIAARSIGFDVLGVADLR
jgi:predicted nucleic acid-binding protein